MLCISEIVGISDVSTDDCRGVDHGGCRISVR